MPLMLDRQHAAHKPREIIVGDITYLPLQAGKWGSLASWQDKCTKRIVGWAVEERMTEELISKAFAKAIKSGSVERGTIIHTDQGSQYVSNNFRALLKVTRCRQSMSRRGNCSDNAQAESFFSRYKAELLEGGMFDVRVPHSRVFHTYGIRPLPSSCIKQNCEHRKFLPKNASSLAPLARVRAFQKNVGDGLGDG
jgi:transposase InsO family protein